MRNNICLVTRLLLAIAFFSFFSLDLFSATKEASNKQVVMNYFRVAIEEKDPEKAARLYGGDYYIQHNPLVRDGWDGFKEFINGLSIQYPDRKANIIRVIAEGDFVVAHVHVTLSKEDALGMAAINIFRLEEGKIVEHWDVMQPVPKKSENGNGVF